ncbi:MAG: PD-(D/E)XK nuclease family protein [Candidatus Asgardarchaeia archaeon]
MSSADEKTILKIIKKLPEILKKHPELKDEFLRIFEEHFVTSEDIKEILTEIRRMRQDFNKVMADFREDFNRQFTAFERRMDAFEKQMASLREDFNRQFTAFEKRIEVLERRMDAFEEHLKALERRMDAFEKQMASLREDFNRQFTAFERAIRSLELRIEALGARWGIYSEDAFRNALRELLEKDFGVKVSRWKHYDSEGIVYRKPSMIEVDVMIKDSEHILIEIKANVRKSDVATLLRISELYEKVTSVKPKLMIISPFVEERARIFAEENGVTISTSTTFK